MQDKIIIELKSKSLKKKCIHEINFNLFEDDSLSYIYEEFAKFLIGAGISEIIDDIEDNGNDSIDRTWSVN